MLKTMTVLAILLVSFINGASLNPTLNIRDVHFTSQHTYGISTCEGNSSEGYLWIKYHGQDGKEYRVYVRPEQAAAVMATISEFNQNRDQRLDIYRIMSQSCFSAHTYHRAAAVNLTK